MTIVTRIADGLQSLATRMGTSGDKAHTAGYVPRVLSDAELEAAFTTSWVMKKVVTVPALDAARKWRQWSDDAQAIEAIENAHRVGLRRKVNEAHWKARLYGGAAILIGTPDPDFAEPMEPERTELQYLAVLTRHDLAAGMIETDPREPLYGRPRHYDITTTTGGMLRIHPSRLVIFTGADHPRVQIGNGQTYGWGDSELQAVWEACRNLDSTMANVAALVFDAKTDVVKIPDLTQNIVDPAYEAALLKRFETARMLKGNHGLLMLDGEEDYQSKSYSFSGLDSIADRFMQVAAGAADIPATRLLGMSPAGMNSTGEGDLANYYDRVASMQTLEIGPALATLDKLILNTAGVDLATEYEWRPLKQMTEEQVSTIRSRDADTISKLAAADIYADDEVAAVGAQLFRESGVDGLSDMAGGGEE